MAYKKQYMYIIDIHFQSKFSYLNCKVHYNNLLSILCFKLITRIINVYIINIATFNTSNVIRDLFRLDYLFCNLTASVV